MPVAINCKRCNKEFLVKPSHVDKRVYCSKECMQIAFSKPRRKLNCLNCGISFEVENIPSRSNAKYCSKKCMGEHKSGENHHLYKEDGYARNKEKQREYNKKYQKENKERILHNSYKGKLKRRKQVEPKHTFIEWIELLKKHDNRCFYCGDKMTKYVGLKQRTRDHIVAIYNGGTDEISNIVPACRSCNSQKGTKTLEEWKGSTTIETTLNKDKGVE